MIFLFVPAAFIPGRRLFQGGVYSNNYGKQIVLGNTLNTADKPQRTAGS